MVAELVDTPIYAFTDHRRAAADRPRRRPRRAARRLALAGGPCRRPPTPAGPALRPARVSVTPVAPGARWRSCGPGQARDQRGPLRLWRVLTAGGLAVVIVCCGFAIRTALGRTGGGPLATTGAPGGSKPAAVQVWIVRPGDTLWSIAEAVDPNGDVRPLVDRLAGEARGPTIYPGESIDIPRR